MPVLATIRKKHAPSATNDLAQLVAQPRRTSAKHAATKFPCGIAQYVDLDLNSISRQAISNQLAPFYNRDAVRGEHLVNAEFKKFVIVANAISVEVMELSLGGLVMAKHKRWANNIRPIYSAGRRYRLYETCFSSPQCSG